MRKAIPEQERLAVTLRFLASGDSYKSISVFFHIAPNTYLFSNQIFVKQFMKPWKENS